MTRKKPIRRQWLHFLAALILFATASFSVTTVPMGHDMATAAAGTSASTGHLHDMAAPDHDHGKPTASTDDCSGTKQSAHGLSDSGECCWAMCMSMALVEQTLPSRVHSVHQTDAIAFRQMVALMPDPRDRPPRNS